MRFKSISAYVQGLKLNFPIISLVNQPLLARGTEGLQTRDDLFCSNYLVICINKKYLTNIDECDY